MNQVTKADIYKLSDFALVGASIVFFDKQESLLLAITPWERALLDSIKRDPPPQLTWKQRRALREIVWDLTETLMQRGELISIVTEQSIRAAPMPAEPTPEILVIDDAIVREKPDR